MLTVTIEALPGGDDDLHLHAGGQGFWDARMARRLGAEVTLCAPLGGETGAVIRGLAASEGVEIAAVETKSANGAYVHDRRSGERVELAQVPSPRLARHEVDELFGMTVAAGLNSDVMLLTGSPRDVVETDVYRRLAVDLRANGVPVLADLAGGYLDAALESGVDLLKLSPADHVAQVASANFDELALGMRELQRAGAKNVLFTRGADPSLLLADDGRLLQLEGPRFEPADPEGSGDAMFATIGVAWARGEGLLAAVRRGVAAGSLNATRHGRGTGSPAEIDRLLSRVKMAVLAS